MKSKEDIKPISYIKAHAADILNQINETHRPVYITQNGEAKAVLIDSDSFEKMQKTIGLLKLIAQGEKDIKDGNYSEQGAFFKSLRSELKKTSDNG
jgi:prevent-host-death family protein